MRNCPKCLSQGVEHRLCYDKSSKMVHCQVVGCGYKYKIDTVDLNSLKKVKTK